MSRGGVETRVLEVARRTGVCELEPRARGAAVVAADFAARGRWACGGGGGGSVWHLVGAAAARWWCWVVSGRGGVGARATTLLRGLHLQQWRPTLPEARVPRSHPYFWHPLRCTSSSCHTRYFEARRLPYLAAFSDPACILDPQHFNRNLYSAPPPLSLYPNTSHPLLLILQLLCESLNVL